MNDSRWRIRNLDVTTSTNDDIRKAAESGEPEGLVIIANRQTGGKGRHGRVWESPEGNLYCSVLLRPKNLPACAGFYSFVAALAVHALVSEYLRPMSSPPPGRGALPDITLKWPNDVLVNGKKISGILLEVADDALIVGIGLNIAHHPETALYPATSLRAELAARQVIPPSRSRPGFAEASPGLNMSPAKPLGVDGEGLGVGAEFAALRNITNFEPAVLLNHLSHWRDTLQTEGFAPIRTAWLKHAHKGSMTVRLSQETLQGTFAGIDDTGRLRLQLDDGAERVISTGDVIR